MTRDDVTKLFRLLGELYPNRDIRRDGVQTAIWAEVLKPWTYPQVRDAVIRRARENEYFPNPSEIAKYLPQEPWEAPMPEQARDNGAKASPDLLEWWADRKRALREAGLPTAADAMRRGMRMADHMMLLEQAGL